MVEPYGVDARGNKMALATANSVRLIDVDTGEARFCQHPWLSQAHTVEFSADGKKLSFDPATGFIDFPGGAKKFAIRFDPETREYWSLASIVHEKQAKEAVKILGKGARLVGEVVEGKGVGSSKLDLDYLSY